MKVIPARFPGRCPICGLTFEQGAHISPTGDIGKWGHSNCVSGRNWPPMPSRGRTPSEEVPSFPYSEPSYEMPPPREPPRSKPVSPELRAFADDPARVGRGRLSYVCRMIRERFALHTPKAGDSVEHMLSFGCPPAVIDEGEADLYRSLLDAGMEDETKLDQDVTRQFQDRLTEYEMDWHRRSSARGQRKEQPAVAAEESPGGDQEVRDELRRMYGPEGVVRLTSHGKKFCTVCRKPVEWGDDVYISLSGKHVTHEKCGKEEARRLIGERKAKSSWESPTRAADDFKKAKAELDKNIEEMVKSHRARWGEDNPRARKNMKHPHYSSSGIIDIMEAMYRPMEPPRGGTAAANPTIDITRGPYTPQTFPYYLPSSTWGEPSKKNPGPRGGFSEVERGQLPDWYFLKPGGGWPAGDPRKGHPDVDHAERVIQYMARGFGNRSEYPSLLRELARRYPPNERRWASIWQKYDRLKDTIAKKAGAKRTKRTWQAPSYPSETFANPGIPPQVLEALKLVGRAVLKMVGRAACSPRGEAKVRTALESISVPGPSREHFFSTTKKMDWANPIMAGGYRVSNWVSKGGAEKGRRAAFNAVLNLLGTQEGMSAAMSGYATGCSAFTSMAGTNPAVDREMVGATMMGLSKAAREGDRWSAIELELIQLQAVIDMHEAVIAQIEAGKVPREYYDETRAKLSGLYDLLVMLRAAQNKVQPRAWKAVANPRRR